MSDTPAPAPEGGPSDTSSELDELLAAAGLVPSRGRKPQHVKYEVLRELELGDVPEVVERAAMPQPLEVIGKLRETHHAIARMLAAGAKDAQICAEIGYSASRISVLKTSPMFQELVAHYRQHATQAFMTGQERLAMIGITAVQEVAERLEETPEKFTNRELLELIEMAGDRTFAPPKGGKSTIGGNGVMPAININFVTPPEGGSAQGPVIDVSPQQA